ncbi:sugar phosphate isomerase/epimerase [Streptomyces sp. DSM 44915]|uniref:Sugar phosphate isomerase/epimerase n=1 Tax=Streptomyces chisholmiae TaxID=3075540 RepID=A0ABU2JRG2_9ACTN|nr:sugar phosphate isomerase/epimerase [Streptomyces sp. DSM 44915]MDT0267517.1 sugar phosphate isomerase/epimerase [Streptomyces sp. DSM 44915]
MTDPKTRPVTLFTGQWYDVPFERIAADAGTWGYDGLEVDCGNHLDLVRAEEDPRYLDAFRATLERNGLGVWALSSHAAGNAVGTPAFDFRHADLLPPHIWGDGEAEGVRARAAEAMKRAARVARKLGVDRVVGFCGSSIWPYVVGFPGVPDSVIEAGYEDFARRWNPILDVFDDEGVVFAHELHPGEIAFDYWTARRAVDALAGRPAFGFNWDPSHLMWQGVDPVAFITDFADRIHHVDCKDTRLRPRDGRSGILGSHLPWGDPRRAWDFVSIGHGDVPWEDAFRALTAIGYTGPISVEWEDMGMNRTHGAIEALAHVRALHWPLP